MDLRELVSASEKLGLTGDALRQRVHEEQALAREARAAEREAEHEQAELERILLLRLRVIEAEAAMRRRAGPSDVTDRSALVQVCILDSIHQNGALHQTRLAAAASHCRSSLRLPYCHSSHPYSASAAAP